MGFKRGFKRGHVKHGLKKIYRPDALARPTRSAWYQKIALHGVHKLPDAFLMAAVQKGNMRRRRIQAERLLWEVGDIDHLRRLGFAGLCELGLKPVEAARLLAALELGRRSVAYPYGSPRQRPSMPGGHAR